MQEDVVGQAPRHYLRIGLVLVNMNWTLPPAAGRRRHGALAPGSRRAPTDLPPLVAEAFDTTLGISGLVWLGWIALWVLEQRW